ncbi:hypothetical protein UREG_06561 [Uncinocarpus reesii 1704]|uniref:Glucan endo-1,3-beta-D-glucosidase 1 n=1 Tax=Uncinocarpus reesii (strain UAMH 1704) TaxID=336963 RepID=C4JVG9_UNCRE|nr:uncharacterized protein UREG_06561 [Uncinocarpus reesii 1704]EEP81696.1 hypothetical protein UREG_06561 [Uncinocarpus reesii 1704]
MVRRVKIWLTEAVLISSGILTSVQSRPFPLSSDNPEAPSRGIFRAQAAGNWANYIPPSDLGGPEFSDSKRSQSKLPSIVPPQTTAVQSLGEPAPVQLDQLAKNVGVSLSSTKTEPASRYRYPPTPVAQPAAFTAQAPFNLKSSSIRSATAPIASSGTFAPPTKSEIIPTSSAMASAMASQDAFLPVSRDQIPSNIPKRGGHPVPKNHIVNVPGPMSTNKFYANFFLNGQQNYSYAHPYSVGWSKGIDPTKSFGLAVSHVDAHQRVLGERSNNIPGNPARYYINPVGIQSIILSATEFGNSTSLSVSDAQAFSTDVILRPQQNANASITFPLVQGMGFVTGVYDNLRPLIQSQVAFRQVNLAASPKNGVFKYTTTLENSTNWLVYVTPTNGVDPKLELVSNSTLRGQPGFKGAIQVARNPGNAESIYDRAAGAYPTKVNIAGSVSGQSGTYRFAWTKAGKFANSTQLLMFALPHHVASFDSASKQPTACVGDSWTMVEPNLPINMGFEPWQPGMSGKPSLSSAAKQAIKAVAPSELSQDMNAQTNLDSMYFSGKALGKFAGVVYTVHEMLQDPGMASTALKTLKECFARFVENKQKHPLVYDTVWKGVVSSGAYTTGDIYLDFGNTLYNDHHFHYGYFILAAAIIGKLDQSWLAANKAWVNMLVRDAANPVADDLFPFSRGFDWYNGHSWAKGLFASIDGKDQESTSEDTMFAYALKMWGKTSGDASMEARGNLMLGILSRSLDNYFLMRNNNTNQPKEFIRNKVTGILFENKCDHATYFGTNLEYIQGIHMLPLLPASAYARRKDFVREEWDAMFASNATKPASTVDGGWRGVLYANLAIIDPGASWNFFAQNNFNMSWIDGGASRTWYLAYAACLGGGPK